MPTSKSYSEKLKDPRWQKKRLEILERDGWACQSCGDTKKTLHIHHKSYNKNPWEIDNWLLQTLCEDCHEEATEKNNLLSGLLKTAKVDDEFKDELIGFLIGKEIYESEGSDWFTLDNYEQIFGLSKYFMVRYSVIEEAMQGDRICGYNIALSIHYNTSDYRYKYWVDGVLPNAKIVAKKANKD